jgi:benzoate 4-monooxygenase
MALVLILAAVFAYLCAKPLIVYFYDGKGLRKYPVLNPLSGITSLAYVWEHLNNFRTRRLYLEHQKHPVIRVGPNVLSFADVRAIKDIYNHGTPCRKDDVYNLTVDSHAHILNTVDREDHARKRRMLSNAFATRNLEQWEFKITEKVGKLVTRLDEGCTAPLSNRYQVNSEDLTIDFTFWFNLFTIDAIADLALSEKLNLLDSGTDAVKTENIRSFKFIDSLHGGNHITSFFVGATEWFCILKVLSSIVSPQFCAQWEDGKNFGKIVGALTGHRLEKHQRGDQLGDLFSCLMQNNKGEARGLERGELEAEANVLCKLSWWKK